MRPVLLLATLLSLHAAAAQTAPHTAAELVSAVKAARPDGGFYVRLRMEHSDKAGASTVLQVQLKRRVAPDGASESLYQVQFPKEKKGEGLLLRVKGGTISGAIRAAAGEVRPITGKDRSTSVLGTALSIDDVAAEFLNWPLHETVGHEKTGSIACAIIDSRPGKSAIEKVRSWIDEARYVPMRVETYPRGGDRPAKTVITHKTMRGGSGYYTPVSFTVTDTATGATTKVEGVRSESGLQFSDADFSEAALRTITPPSGK